MIIDDEIKNMLISYMNNNHEFIKLTSEQIYDIQNNVISRNLCLKLLDALMYIAVCKKNIIDNYSIANISLYQEANNIYSSLPKNPDYEKYPGVFRAAVPDFSMESDFNLKNYLGQLLIVNNMFKTIQEEQSLIYRAMSILHSIESIKKQSLELTDIEKQKLDIIYSGITTVLKSNDIKYINELNKWINDFSEVATIVWNKCLDTNNYYLVHNFSRGYSDDFTPSNYLSTSLVMPNYTKLFQENRGNNYGIIVRPHKIVSADYKDSFTYNRVDEFNANMYMNGQIPPLMFPWEIEEYINNGSISLPEIVIEGFDIVCVYYKDDGSENLTNNYNMAKLLSQKYNVELVELNDFLCRIDSNVEQMDR